MNESIKHIARQIKEAREAKGLSQRALSKKVGIPQSHISKIENGAVNLQLSSLIELTRVLGLELMLVPKEAKKTAEVVVNEIAMAQNKEILEKEMNLAIARLNKYGDDFNRTGLIQNRALGLIGRGMYELEDEDS